jgi:hypothetical protein
LKREKHPHHQKRKLKRSTPGCQKGRMKKRVRVMQKYSKEGIMVNKNQRRMSIIEIHLQQDLPHSSNKEASIMMKGSTEEKIMINQGRNSEGLHHKEDHSLPGM